MRCCRCGHEIIACPTLCRFSGWKHMDSGRHECDLPNVTLPGRYEYRRRRLFAYPDS